MKKQYNNIIIAKRYAKALFYYAYEVGESQLVYNDMMNLEKLISKSSQFYSLIKNPLIINKQKIEIIIDLINFSSKNSLKFIKLIFQNNRGLIIQLITREYKKLYYFINKIYQVTIITAIYIDKKIKEEIINKILYNIKYDIKYEIDNKIDPQIIGGFCIYIKEKKLDFTIKKLIFDIKNNFIN